MLLKRHSSRKLDSLREVSISPNILHNADGSCLIKFGNTHVICSATIEERLPSFLKNKNQGGWLTAEYGMLPSSTCGRLKREASSGKQSGRTQEIQRLIGRSLRASIDLKKLGERQIIIDCDVVNADGGTRCASITGGYVALHIAITKLLNAHKIRINPLLCQIAAISCGIVDNTPILDLDYVEDSEASVDANFVINSNGKLIEVQASAEKQAFSEEDFFAMLEMAKISMAKLFALQNKAILGL